MVAIVVLAGQRLALAVHAHVPARDVGLATRYRQDRAGLFVESQIRHAGVEALFPFRRVARLALRPARFLAFGHLLLRHLGRVPAVVQAQVVLAGVAAQPGVDHAASEAAVFRRHEAVVDANLLEQAGVDEIRLAVAGDVADLQVQVLAGRVQAVGGVHAVQLEQVLVGAGAVEGQVFHVQRAPVLRTVGAGIDAHRRVAGDQRCQVAVGTGRLGDLFAGVGPLAGLFAVDAHRVQAVGREQIGLVHVDDVAARTVRFQGQAGSSQQVVQRQQRRVLAPQRRRGLAGDGGWRERDFQACLAA